MNKLTKIITGTLAAAGILLGMAKINKNATEYYRSATPDVIEPANFHMFNPNWTNTSELGKFDVDGDGIKDDVRYANGAMYFRSGAEPNGYYRRIKPGTDIADRVNEYWMLQLDGIGFPEGFKLKGYKF